MNSKQRRKRRRWLDREIPKQMKALRAELDRMLDRQLAIMEHGALALLRDFSVPVIG